MHRRKQDCSLSMQCGMNWPAASFLKAYSLNKISQIEVLHVVGFGAGVGVGRGFSQYGLSLSTTFHSFAI